MPTASIDDLSLDEQALIVLSVTQGVPELDRERERRNWRRRSPSHQSAYERVLQEWELMGEIVDRPLSNVEKAQLRAQLFVARAIDNPARIATACVLAALVWIVSVVTLDGKPSDPTAVYPREAMAWHRSAGGSAQAGQLVQTARGEQCTLRLADGSRLWLNWNTRIRLLERGDGVYVDVLTGDVLFSSSHQRDRPLVVHTGRIYAYATDSDFAIHSHGNDDATIQVKTGLLTITSADTQQTRHLGPAEQMRFSKGLGASLGETDLNSIAAWREGALVFDERPLEEVLGELSHYTERPLQIASEWFPDADVSAVYALSEADQAVVEFADAFNLELIESEHDSILVRSIDTRRR